MPRGKSKPQVWGDTPVHTINIDWDGCAVPAMWPERPNHFNYGFVEAMRRFHKQGWKLQIFTARISPFDPWTGQRRDAAVNEAEIQYIRHMLDEAGLTYIDIWRREGKPGGSVYIDDKAERYGGTRRSWEAVCNKVLIRLGNEDAVFPAMSGEED